MCKGKVDPISAEMVKKADIPKPRVPKKKKSSNLTSYKINQIGKKLETNLAVFRHPYF
jgi:hypothetical protein